MYPILYENSWLLIPAWHTFYVLGAFLGYWVFLTGLSFAPLENRRQASKLFLLIYFSGYFGARIFALLVEEDYRPWQTDFWFELSKLGAMTLYGGVISGLIATLLYCKKKRLSIAAYFDPLVIAALVAIAIGRIGCFLNGDDYGIAIPNQSDPAPWWAVAFPNHIEHVYRYPTQLMETAICLMFALEKRSKAPIQSDKSGLMGFFTNTGISTPHKASAIS